MSYVEHLEIRRFRVKKNVPPTISEMLAVTFKTHLELFQVILPESYHILYPLVI